MPYNATVAETGPQEPHGLCLPAPLQLECRFVARCQYLHHYRVGPKVQLPLGEPNEQPLGPNSIYPDLSILLPAILALRGLLFAKATIRTEFERFLFLLSLLSPP